MGVYFKKGKGYRFDFTIKGKRYTKAWFKTKQEARDAEAEHRKKVKMGLANPVTPTGMVFLEMVNRRLDYLMEHDYSSEYVRNTKHVARKWVKEWGGLPSGEVSPDMIWDFLVRMKNAVSVRTANLHRTQLRSLFAWAMKRERRYAPRNPLLEIDPFPYVTPPKEPYVPTPEEIDKVLDKANEEQRDYLTALRHTLARQVEVHRLTWADVHFDENRIVLHTRKKRSRSMTPRSINMTATLRAMLEKRFAVRDPEVPFVFWHSCWDKTLGRTVKRPYARRNKLLGYLCREAGVPYFAYHSLRRSGATVMDEHGVPLAAIQRVLGHGERKSTERYIKKLSAIEVQAMDVFETASRNPKANHTQKTHTTAANTTAKGRKSLKRQRIESAA